MMTFTEVIEGLKATPKAARYMREGWPRGRRFIRMEIYPSKDIILVDGVATGLYMANLADMTASDWMTYDPMDSTFVAEAVKEFEETATTKEEQLPQGHPDDRGTWEDAPYLSHFAEMIECLDAGFSIARKAWEKGRYIKRGEKGVFDHAGAHFIPTMEELTADDWFQLPKPKTAEQAEKELVALRANYDRTCALLQAKEQELNTVLTWIRVELLGGKATDKISLRDAMSQYTKLRKRADYERVK